MAWSCVPRTTGPKRLRDGEDTRKGPRKQRPVLHQRSSRPPTGVSTAEASCLPTSGSENFRPTPTSHPRNAQQCISSTFGSTQDHRSTPAAGMVALAAPYCKDVCTWLLGVSACKGCEPALGWITTTAPCTIREVRTVDNGLHN